VFISKKGNFHRLFSWYPRVFLVIRQYFFPSASISRHPPVFLAIRQYFSPSASKLPSQTPPNQKSPSLHLEKEGSAVKTITL
jgi:hypothetical protein